MLNDAYDTYDNHETQSSFLIWRQEQLIVAKIVSNESDDMKKQALENLKLEAKRSLTKHKLQQGNMGEFLAQNQPTNTRRRIFCDVFTWVFI